MTDTQENSSRNVFTNMAMNSSKGKGTHNNDDISFLGLFTADKFEKARCSTVMSTCNNENGIQITLKNKQPSIGGKKVNISESLMNSGQKKLRKKS